MTAPPEGIPIELTLAEMDATGVEKAFLRAWMRPEGVDHLQRRHRRHRSEVPRPLPGDGHRRPPQADGRRPRARARRQGAWAEGAAHAPLDLEPSAQRQALLPAVREVHRAGHPLLLPGRAHRPPVPLGAGAADPVHRRGGPGLPRADHRGRAHRLSLDRRDDRPGRQVPQRLHRHVGPSPQVLPARAGQIHEQLAGRTRCCSPPTTPCCSSRPASRRSKGWASSRRPRRSSCASMPCGCSGCRS